MVSENVLYGPGLLSSVEDGHRLVLNQLTGAGEVWAVAADGQLYAGGLCNRNLSAFANELPLLLNPVVVAGDSAQNEAASVVG